MVVQVHSPQGSENEGKPDIIASNEQKLVVLDTQIKSSTLELPQENDYKREYYGNP